jgi:hypothetical protein
MIAAGLLALALAQDPGFDHLKHRTLFPSCASCHAGAERAGAPLWPAAASCAECHDGTIESRVTWTAPTVARRTNLRFDHVRHAATAKDTTVTCRACHTEAGAPRMAVQAAAPGRCLQCHGIQTAHLAAPDTACAKCHVALAQAATLTRVDIAAFDAPPSHGDPLFAGRDGHGSVERQTVSGSCATCHAREFCYQCHAGGAPPRVIAALASDPRSTAIAARSAPASHGATFADRHGAPAAAAGSSCAGCHVRAECLDCHRPAAAAGPGYHAAGFLSRHPAAAYARETSCGDCHNVGAFCTACHAQAGLVASDVLRAGYHDAKQFFLFGHGQAARQSLESCVACHTERDCLTCHSALGGRRFNPHGPGFDANRMRRKNPEVCTACHGTAIPTR